MIIIMRGIPGSGKTYNTKRNFVNVPRTIHLSTDMFFEGPGGYEFDPRRIGEAHAWCTREFLKHLSEIDEARARAGAETDEFRLVVDNTNIHAWEIAPYAQAGIAYGHGVRVITHWCDPTIAARRNTHGVPFQVIVTMHANLLAETPKLPPWWNHEAVDLR